MMLIDSKKSVIKSYFEQEELRELNHCSRHKHTDHLSPSSNVNCPIEGQLVEAFSCFVTDRISSMLVDGSLFEDTVAPLLESLCQPKSTNQII
jgi:hypothetical protein